MGSQYPTDIPKMKAVLVLSVFIAQAFAECEPPMPSECGETDISCDMGTYADCWLGDLCMPEGSICPPSCSTPAPSECLDGEVMCDMGTSADGCWLGDYCMAEGSDCPTVCFNPPPSECAASDISCDMGTHEGCWLGDFCMPEGSICPPTSESPSPSPSEGETTVVPGTESPLVGLNINPDTIAISGFSSGAAFSTQFHVAFSKTISGIGAFAGIRYIQDVSDGDIVSLTNSLASQGLIDPVENMSNDNIYIQHGQADSVVPWEQAGKIKNFYQNYLADGNNIEIKDDIMGEHGFPTNDQGGFCLFLASPNYVNNCDYDGAFHILQKTLGEIAPKTDDGEVDYELKDFDQAEFFEDNDAEGNSLDKNGYVFIPDSCANGSVQCHLHVHLHGCTQTREWIGDGYIRETGFLPLANANNVVMVFPQIKANAANPNGCWNFWGYLGDADNYQYATKQGKQMKAMAKMVEKAASVSMF